jgi:hypothetical protein
LSIKHNTSGTAADGFGTLTTWTLDSSTTANQSAASFEVAWDTAAHATRASRWHFHCQYTSVQRECLALGANSAGPLIGFLGAAKAAAQTGDAGTALVTFGLMSGTPTFAGANITGTGTIPAAAYPTMVAAGGSHAKGAVGDPGATAHTNYSYYWGDDAAFHKPLGYVIGRSRVDTSETTTSATPVELTTTQQIAFTLDVTSDIEIHVTCGTSNSSAGATNRVEMDLDGSSTIVSRLQAAGAGANYNVAGHIIYTSVAAGAHTLKLKFDTTAGTATFFNRMMTVRLVG